MKFKGVKFLIAVSLLYAVVGALHSEKSVAALEKSGMVLTKIGPILLIVIFITAVIDYFFNPKDVAAHLGEKCSLKGWLIALAAGIASHGPMYAWYPMIEDLKRHGLRKGLIATFFYARSIKVPLLPIMIDYFGLAFTFVLTLYILIASVIQGILIDRLCSKINRCD
ncbi:permease [Hydrogenimonas urashimensis]|uniref:permease n=1 Tax=Hydrogenimonas urashimensis TaxID=2740515 RepID=UPI00191593D0|nr:permease [Hydrogenimonas urashimensis]